MTSRDEDVVKYMASLLKSGATMLDKSCPVCKTPLFKLKTGEVMCPKCKRRVFIVSSEEEEAKVYSSVAVSSLERTIAEKLSELDLKLRSAEDLEELRLATMILIGLLDALEKIRKLSREA